MLRTIFIMVMFFHSVTPFCYGVYAVVNCLCIPFTSQKLLNSFYVNSLPRSTRKARIGVFVSFSTQILNLLKASKTYDFSVKKKTHVFLLKSSIKVNKYHFLLLEMGLIGPQMLACNN